MQVKRDEVDVPKRAALCLRVGSQCSVGGVRMR
jgi:hypothetical protein